MPFDAELELSGQIKKDAIVWLSAIFGDNVPKSAVQIYQIGCYADCGTVCFCLMNIVGPAGRHAEAQ